MKFSKEDKEAIKAYLRESKLGYDTSAFEMTQEKEKLKEEELP